MKEGSEGEEEEEGEKKGLEWEEREEERAGNGVVEKGEKGGR